MRKKYEFFEESNNLTNFDDVQKELLSGNNDEIFGLYNKVEARIIYLVSSLKKKVLLRIQL
jgi:hypothetical protein